MRERAALNAERTRIARDLHDGLAQDLAVIVTQARRLATRLGDEHPLTIAARRALDDLPGRDHRSVGVARLGRARGAARGRRRTRVALRRRGLGRCRRLRIRRAGAPRCRRSRAPRADRARGDRQRRHPRRRAPRRRGALGRRLGAAVPRVPTTAPGSQTASARPRGFGLPAMRSRARALGGQLIARRRPAGGTEIEVSVVARHALVSARPGPQKVVARRCGGAAGGRGDHARGGQRGQASGLGIGRRAPGDGRMPPSAPGSGSRGRTTTWQWQLTTPVNQNVKAQDVRHRSVRQLRRRRRVAAPPRRPRDLLPRRRHV